MPLVSRISEDPDQLLSKSALTVLNRIALEASRKEILSVLEERDDQYRISLAPVSVLVAIAGMVLSWFGRDLWRTWRKRLRDAKILRLLKRQYGDEFQLEHTFFY